MPPENSERPRYRFRASHIASLFGGFLVLAILASLGAASWTAREQTIKEWRKQLSNLSLVLAEHIGQQVTSASLVLDSVADSVQTAGADSDASLRDRMSSQAVFLSMRDKVRGLPQVDVVTIVAANGDVVNFTRSWPAPAINLADRDYFTAHLRNPGQGMFFSKPVRNKGNGEWTFYLSRRLNGPRGEFIGIVLAGFSCASLSDFYQRITLGEGASISLYRRDFTLLARWPHVDALMGQINRGGSSYQVIEQMHKSDDVILTSAPRFSQDRKNVTRLGAPRLVENYPLIVNLTITETLMLARWREFNEARILLAALASLAVAGASVVLLRLLQRRERDLALTRHLMDKADAANRAKSDFLAMMSHEVRTPLTAIIGFAELLGTADEPAQRGEAGQVILRNGQHLLSVINDILDIAKIEAGRLGLEQVAFSPVQIVAEIDSMMGAQAHSKGIGFGARVRYPFPAQVVGDPTRWKQILFNLCSNAIKFTELGGVELDLWYEDDPARLVCKVLDTGIGMSPQQCARLFAPFQQAGLDTTRKYGGTGLGLYLVQQLATRMGGAVQVSSEPGQGSAFEVGILARAQDGTPWLAGAAPPASPAAAAAGAPPALHGRVLLAEDGPDNRALIGAFLSRLGVHCEMAENGARAVEMALAGSFDLILMDIQMPLMDGVTATELLRAAGVGIPVVALTANIMTEDVARYLAAGCSHCVGKPIDFTALGLLLAQLLPAVPAAPAPAMSPAQLAVFAEIRARFEAGLVTRLEQIAGHLAAGEAAEAAALAHMLKGSAGSFGYPRVTELAGALERALLDGEPAAGAGLLVQLQQLDDVRRLLAPAVPQGGDDE
ncbi:ATP-binding protein [Massilia sp. CCM 9210]|uniref:ATP-binding protein n=1 Tax=Massilia scottii TaxID=3057166 RepID=UPI002796DAEC|nr:ATP-binding protein [Massilia sp. CCM 9210]MDQ1814003.1 ATP-binding protein [Massilia sp. CCM 9210]